MSMPNSPRTSPRKGKYLECKVHMLDDTWQQFWIHPKSLGQVLYDEVIKHLQLLESDYFDLEYKNPEGFCSWLDHEKPVLKQLSPPHVYLKFLVKFYTPDPGLLEEEYTRYLFALQVKRDLETGAMPCQEHTAVLLASYIVQAELGDFLEDEYLDHTYLSNLKLLPQQNDNLLIKIMDHHREHVGQTPEQADFNLLDTARKVELYGIRMHPAKDHEGVALQLAVAHMGVLVFQNYVKINTFSWAKIRKLSFKRKKFLIKLHPEGYGYYKDTVEFYFDSRNECKNFWKKCIEHHAFFRCHVVKKVPRNKTRVVSRGSSFRYSGRTQKQLVEFVRENYVKRPPFERVNSLRSTGSGTGRRKAANSQSHHSLSKHSPRTTSLRTVSSTRSAVATPKTGTLNSRDIHFGRDANQNPSTSSGSHTIDMSRSNENMMDSTQAEVHDESFNSMSRRSRGSPRRDRSYDRSLNRSLERAHERAQNHYQASPPMPPPRDDYQPRQVETEKGREDFNYSYYQITYDGQGLRDYPHGMGEQNANDNDEAERDFDNVSHDSYPLTESRDSLEGELDAPGGPLEGDEVAELRRELEREFGQREGAGQVTAGGPVGQSADGGRGVARSADAVGESQQGLVGLRCELGGGVRSPYLSGEDLHVISVKPLESKDGKKQVEIQIVQKVETTHLVEKVERMNVVRHGSSLEQNVSDDDLELVRVEFEPEHNVTKETKSNEPEPVTARGPTYDEEERDEKHELQNGDVKQATGKAKRARAAETNGADLNEEIPYYLHKRVVSPARGGGGELVQLIRTRGRSPSPRRPQMVIPQTKEQEKAQLDKIKSGFTEPLASGHGTPLSPQSKSPGLKRAFDYVVCSKLPPPDSFSSVDDSLSPSLEKEIMAHIKSKIEAPGDGDRPKKHSAKDDVREPVRKRSKEENRFEESTIVGQHMQADAVLAGQETSAMIGRDDLLESDSDHEEVTCLREPDIEEDVNRLLSECGQDSRSISSVSDHDVFDDGEGADDRTDDRVGDDVDAADASDDVPVKERVLPPGEQLQKPPLLPRPPVEFDEREEDEYLRSARTSGGSATKPDDKFPDLPSPPPPPPPLLMPEDDSSSLDEAESPPPPPTICEIEDSEDEDATPFHPPALLAPSLSSPDEELTLVSMHASSSAGGLDIPAICIRAATPIDSPSSDESPPQANASAADHVVAGDELAAAEESSVRESSPEFEAEPLTVELHIDEDRLMKELAIEEALEEGRVALAEGETEESALQRVGAALAEKALREALIQAALMGELRGPESDGIKDESDSSTSLSSGDVPPRPPSPIPPDNPDYFSDSDADVERPGSEEHADAMEILKESARARPFELPRAGDEKRVMFAEQETSSEEESDSEVDGGARASSAELGGEVKADPGSDGDQRVDSANISPDDQVHYDVELEPGELLEALAEEARRKSFSLPFDEPETDPSTAEEDSSPDESVQPDEAIAPGRSTQPGGDFSSERDSPPPADEASPVQSARPPVQEISPEPSTHCEADLELEELARALAEEARAKPFTAGPQVLGEEDVSPPSPSSESESLLLSKETDKRDAAADDDDRSGGDAHLVSADSRPSGSRPPPLLPKPKVDRRFLQQVDGTGTVVSGSSHDQSPVNLGSSNSNDNDEERERAKDLADPAPRPRSDPGAKEAPEVADVPPPLPPPDAARHEPDLEAFSDSSDSDVAPGSGDATKHSPGAGGVAAGGDGGGGGGDDDDDLEDGLEALEKLDAPGLVHSSSDDDDDDDTNMQPADGTNSTVRTSAALSQSDKQPS